LEPGLAATEVLLQRLRQDPAPAILGAQLLRTSHGAAEEAGDWPQGRDHRIPPCVARRHRQPRLASVLGLAGNTVKQKRPAGDRLAVTTGVRQPHEQAPPVVGERDQPRHVPAALEIQRGEATPTPPGPDLTRNPSPRHSETRAGRILATCSLRELTCGS